MKIKNSKKASAEILHSRWFCCVLFFSQRDALSDQFLNIVFVHVLIFIEWILRLSRWTFSNQGWGIRQNGYINILCIVLFSLLVIAKSEVCPCLCVAVFTCRSILYSRGNIWNFFTKLSFLLPRWKFKSPAITSCVSSFKKSKCWGKSENNSKGVFLAWIGGQYMQILCYYFEGCVFKGISMSNRVICKYSLPWWQFTTPSHIPTETTETMRWINFVVSRDNNHQELLVAGFQTSFGHKTNVSLQIE